MELHGIKRAEQQQLIDAHNARCGHPRDASHALARLNLTPFFSAPQSQQIAGGGSALRKFLPFST